MPYLVSSIIAVVSAMIIMFTRYEADDSAITAELDRMKSMFVMVDGFVNTYVESGGDLTGINFQKLSCSGILSGNIIDTLAAIDCDTTTTTVDGASDNITGALMDSKLEFPSSSVIWQIIPVRIDDPVTTLQSSAGSAYKLLVDMSANSGLRSKAIFAESFSGREFCEKMLFGTLDRKGNDFVPANNTFGTTGTDIDGKFVCIVFK
jgi:hypothetical protein